GPGRPVPRVVGTEADDRPDGARPRWNFWESRKNAGRHAVARSQNHPWMDERSRAVSYDRALGKPEWVAGPQRDQRRADILVRVVNHPNVATIYDGGESDGIHFIVMEHVEGDTIAARIGESPLSPSAVID